MWYNGGHEPEERKGGWGGEADRGVRPDGVCRQPFLPDCFYIDNNPIPVRPLARRDGEGRDLKWAVPQGWRE